MLKPSCPNPNPPADQPLAADWGLFYRNSITALRRHYDATDSSAPATIARIVARELPARFAGPFLDALRTNGWLADRARIPADILERGAMQSTVLDGPLRPFARLALFGLPGQGLPSEKKNREAVYQHLAAEILREGSDVASLSRVAARAFCHPDVCQDAGLAAQLRAIVAGREAELVRQQRDRERDRDQASQPNPDAPGPGTGVSVKGSLRGRGMVRRTILEFEDHVAHFDEAGADRARRELERLCRLYPEQVPRKLVDRVYAAFDAFRQRCSTWTRQIDELARRGVAAAESGDHRVSAWIIRRLHAIHALRGELLSSEHLDELVQAISTASQSFEAREAATELIDREREVANDVKKLAAGIRRFHAIVRRHPTDDAVFRHAEAEYRELVRAARHYDQGWLTGLFMELEDMVGELQDSTGQAERQINRFIESVRRALLAIRREIEEIHTERQGSPTSPPPSGSA